MKSLNQIIIEAIENKKKIGRDAFVYIERDQPNFAQCSTCFLNNNGNCIILDHPVSANDSCAMYVPDKGEEHCNSKPASLMSDQEAGFVEKEVRCENCRYGGTGKCALYLMLNKKFSDTFDLNEEIKPFGCCNAFMEGK